MCVVVYVVSQVERKGERLLAALGGVEPHSEKRKAGALTCATGKVELNDGLHGRDPHRTAALRELKEEMQLGAKDSDLHQVIHRGRHHTFEVKCEEGRVTYVVQCFYIDRANTWLISSRDPCYTPADQLLKIRLYTPDQIMRETRKMVVRDCFRRFARLSDSILKSLRTDKIPVAKNQDKLREKCETLKTVNVICMGCRQSFSTTDTLWRDNLSGLQLCPACFADCR